MVLKLKDVRKNNAIEMYGRCPYAAAQKVLAGRWTILIMHLLYDGPVRFNELLRRLPNITQATLSRQLKQLEQNGLIIRTEYNQIPPKVEYSLSDLGSKFDKVLDPLKEWGLSYIEYMNEGVEGVL